MENKKIKKEDSIEYVKKYVAFVDILGFRELIEQDVNSSKESIKKIEDTITEITIFLKKHDKELSIRLFSDCMCVSYNYSPEKIMDIVLELAFLQIIFSLKGIFLRGSISTGLHYESEHIIFSEALVSAYNMSEKAVYPRITIDKSIFDEIGILDNNDKYNHILRAPDGLYFVDYLEVTNKMEIGALLQEGWQYLHKEMILNQVKTHLSDQKVLDKYRWLAEYHNTKVDEFYALENSEKKPAQFFNDNKIDIDKEFPKFQKVH